MNDLPDDRLPAIVLDERLKQRWSHLFKALNDKSREARASGQQELGERLRDVARKFNPSKRSKVAPCQADSDYDSTMDSFNQLGNILHVIPATATDEAAVREVEQVSAAVLDYLKARKPHSSN